MQLEDYFDFLAPDDVRIRGSRIGIETVLYQYIHRAQTPEAIAATYPTLRLAEIYATILYYLENREQIDAYMADWIEFGHRMREEQDRNSPPVVQRLRALRWHAKRAGMYEPYR